MQQIGINRSGSWVFKLAGACAAVLAALVVVLTLGAAGPEPDPVPRRWELNFTPGPLRLATVADSEGVEQTYFYFTYTVTNKSGEDVLFAPLFELATDEGEILRSGKDVPASAASEIQEMLENPLLQDQVSIIGELRQGPENAREGIVIWPASDLAIDEIVIYAAGFSGETKEVVLPDTEETVTLRKVYRLRYRVPGTLEDQGSRPIGVHDERWIMREGGAILSVPAGRADLGAERYRTRTRKGFHDGTQEGPGLK